MKTTQIADAITELNDQDTAFIVVEAIQRLGQHARPAGELLKGHVESLSPHARIDFDEGMAWLEDFQL